MFRGLINCDIDNLNKLNQIYKWIPSGNQIRRSKSTQDKYERDMKNVKFFYNSYKDYILDIIFEIPTNLDRNGKCLAQKIDITQCKLCKNKYPYDIPEGTHHYILWYLNVNPSKGQITRDIIENIQNKKKLDKDLQFVWYENPKINKEIYHIHVFINQSLEN